MTRFSLYLGYLGLLLGVGTACVEIKDSPFGDEPQTGVRNFNIKQISRLESQLNSDDFEFAIITDSHQNYADLEKVVDRLNKNSDIQFILHLGDFTDLSYNFEYDLYVERMKDLGHPIITLIGNHDGIGAGQKLYRKIFGPYNSTMQFANTKMIFWNGNGLEFDDLNLDWLESEIESTALADQVFVFTHPNFDSKDVFSKSEKTRVTSIIASSKVDFAAHGHQHVFSLRNEPGHAPVYQVGRVEGEQYALVRVNQGVLTLRSCKKSRCEQVYNENL